MHKSTSISVRTVHVCIPLGVRRIEVAEMIHMIPVTTPTPRMLLVGRIRLLLKGPSVMRAMCMTVSVHSTPISTEICAGSLRISTAKMLLLMSVRRESVEVAMLANIGVWVKSAVRAALVIIDIVLIARVK